MMTHDGRKDRSDVDRATFQHLISAAGITTVIVAVLVHLGGGAVLVHAGLSGVLASLGLGSDALVVVIVAVIAVKLVVVFGLGRRLPHQ
jgi:hypothetical protein